MFYDAFDNETFKETKKFAITKNTIINMSNFVVYYDYIIRFPFVDKEEHYENINELLNRVNHKTIHEFFKLDNVNTNKFIRLFIFYVDNFCHNDSLYLILKDIIKINILKRNLIINIDNTFNLINGTKSYYEYIRILKENSFEFVEHIITKNNYFNLIRCIISNVKNRAVKTYL